MAKNERDDYLRVGVITDTHGIRGEVKVYPTTEDPKRFELLPTVHVIAKDGSDVALKVCGVKYFKNLVILKFDGINNINDIEQYKKCEMFVTREEAIPLEEGEHYVADLIGLRVITDDGVELGVLEDVFRQLFVLDGNHQIGKQTPLITEDDSFQCSLFSSLITRYQFVITQGIPIHDTLLSLMG